MAKVRPPKETPKKLLSPATDPKILDEWRELYQRYTEEEGYKKWAAMQRIALEYGGKSASNVRAWLEPNVRLREKEANLKRGRSEKYIPQYNSRQATTMYLRRNIADYVLGVFNEPPQPLTADEITLNIRDRLIAQNKPGVLLRNRTLLNLVDQYHQANGQQLLNQVPETDPPTYLPAQQS